MSEEIIFLTVHYQCGHDACRPVWRHEHKRDPMNLSGDEREVYSPNRCKHCIAISIRALERRMERQGGVA